MTDLGYDEEQQGSPIPDFLRDPMGIPMRRWPWMLLGLVIGLGATAGNLYDFSHQYEAEATIVVTSQYIPEDFVRTTVREDPFSQLNALVGQVLSRSKLASLIEKYELYAELRESSTTADIVEVMKADISISPQATLTRQRGQASRVYSISYKSHDPEIAADVSNSLAGLFLEAGLKNRMEQAIGITTFLQKELRRAEDELGRQNAEIASFKQMYRGELPDELSSNLSRLERLQSRREAATRQLTEARSRLALLSASDADPLSPTSRLVELQARLDNELAINTPEHPNVTALKRQIESLESQVSGARAGQLRSNTSRSTLLRSAENNIASLEADIARYELEAEALDEQVRRTAIRQEELVAMEQKATVLRENYLEFLRKVDEAELAQTLESNQYGSQISIMDSAHAPSHPINSRRRILLLGVLGALGLAVGLALLFEILNPLIVDPDQVEAISGLPVLGSVPNIT